MYIPTKQLALSLLALAACATAITILLSWHHDRSRDALIADVRTEIARTRGILVSLASVTARNDLDPAAGTIIIDCPERNRYEEAMSKLDSLKGAALSEASHLFSACGDHYALRKRLMASRLFIHNEEFKAKIALLEHYVDAPEYVALSESWEVIAEAEKQRGELLTAQVALQRTIIDSLIAGERNVASGLESAQEIAERLSVLDKQLEVMRNEEATRWAELEGAP